MNYLSKDYTYTTRGLLLGIDNVVEEPTTNLLVEEPPTNLLTEFVIERGRFDNVYN